MASHGTDRATLRRCRATHGARCRWSNYRRQNCRSRPRPGWASCASILSRRWPFCSGSSCRRLDRVSSPSRTRGEAISPCRRRRVSSGYDGVSYPGFFLPRGRSANILLSQSSGPPAPDNRRPMPYTISRRIPGTVRFLPRLVSGGTLSGRYRSGPHGCVRQTVTR
jgi:hypothetical protein